MSTNNLALKEEFLEIFDEEIFRVSQGREWTWRNFSKIVDTLHISNRHLIDHEEFVSSVLEKYLTSDKKKRFSFYDVNDFRLLLVIVPLLAIKYISWSVRYSPLLQNARFARHISEHDEGYVKKFSSGFQYIHIYTSHLAYDVLKYGDLRYELHRFSAALRLSSECFHTIDENWTEWPGGYFHLDADGCAFMNCLQTRIRAFSMLKQMRHFYDRKTRRFFLILECLGALTWEKFVLLHSSTRTYKQYLDILFVSTAEPYPSLSEIKECLELFIEPSADLEAFVQRIWADISNLFPQSGDNPNPRSLLHLCRCSIRDSLKGAQNYPDGVKLLKCPCKLKSYISRAH